MDPLHLISAFAKTMEAKAHTPVYTMHKYFARRPWNVFRELISHYSSPGEVVLDPFCGGGVTVVEALKLGRKVVGVDVNPLATHITEMEVRPLDLGLFERALSQIRKTAKPSILSLYRTTCSKCNSKAFADWIEWDESTKQIVGLKFACPTCGASTEKSPNEEDTTLARKIEQNFATVVGKQNLWFPKTSIPFGDKTSSLLAANISHFYELFTKRNLLALSILKKEIDLSENADGQTFLRFAFSSSLKWASRQSHLRGEIVEGWAMHAYWIYPKSLEINVWNTFERRCEAIVRGKRYSNRHIGSLCKFGHEFADVINGSATCLVMTRNAADLPVADESVDTVITDPPYGGNVNYGELADFWLIWLDDGKILEKKDEVIINKTQGKALEDYENLLCSVLKECYRVLKPHGCLVSTFNSRDLRVVASFVLAASRAGFILHPDGLHYQSPIRAYTTTFHAMQVGAFVGDFVFTFVKEKHSRLELLAARQDLEELRRYIVSLVDDNVKGATTETQVRERAYRALIPFLSKYSRADIESCRTAVDFFEKEMKRYEDHFREIRSRITETRRAVYLSRKNRRKKLAPISSGQASLK